MNIAINCRFLIEDKLEGIGVYTYETTRRLVTQHPEHHFVLIFDRPYAEEFVFGENCTPVVLTPPARHPMLWYIWFEWRLPALLRRHQIDVLYSPDSYLSTRSRVPTTLIVHDLAYRHYPLSIPRWVRSYYESWFPRYFRKAKNIGTVSHATAEDMEVQYAELDLGAKMSYTPCAAASVYSPRGLASDEQTRARYTEGDEYFLYVGAIHPRKNVINLLKAFYRFKKFYRCSYRLVLVGRVAWMSDDFERYLSEHPYRADIIHLQGLDSDALASIYSAAYAFVYPSLFEGFGMPILESLQSGVPVIVSDTSSMPEVAGAAGLLIDPESPQDIADKMAMLYKDEALYAELRSRCAAQAAHFSWEDTSQSIWDMLMAK